MGLTMNLGHPPAIKGVIKWRIADLRLCPYFKYTDFDHLKPEGCWISQESWNQICATICSLHRILHLWVNFLFGLEWLRRSIRDPENPQMSGIWRGLRFRWGSRYPDKPEVSSHLDVGKSDFGPDPLSTIFLVAWISFRVIPLLVPVNLAEIFALVTILELCHCVSNSFVFLTFNPEVCCFWCRFFEVAKLKLLIFQIRRKFLISGKTGSYDSTNNYPNGPSAVASTLG